MLEFREIAYCAGAFTPGIKFHAIGLNPEHIVSVKPSRAYAPDYKEDVCVIKTVDGSQHFIAGIVHELTDKIVYYMRSQRKYAA